MSVGEKLIQPGVKVENRKAEAIINTPAPTDEERAQRFLGMANYIGKFVPNLAAQTSNLRALDVHCTWIANFNKGFERLKDLIKEAPVMRYYNGNCKTKLSTDVSKEVVAQSSYKQHGQNSRPMGELSQTLTKTVCRRAQTEKEALPSGHGLVVHLLIAIAKRGQANISRHARTQRLVF